jgi:hypothetical protein
MLQISQLANSIIPLLLGMQPTELAVRDDDPNIAKRPGKPSFESISRRQYAPRLPKKRSNTYRLETPLKIWEKTCALAVAQSLLWKRAGL